MDRRTFLGGLGALAALGWPLSSEAAVPEGVARVSSAYRDAVKGGKLLLVLVVPTNDPTWERRWERQHAFGELLTWADEATKRRLGSCVLVAATMAELGALVPQADDGKQPVFVLIDPRGVPARAIPLGTEVPKLAVADPMTGWSRAAQTGGDPEDFWAAQQREEAAAVDARVAALSALLVSIPESDTEWSGAAPAGGEYWIASGCGAWSEDPSDDDGGMRMACGMGHVAAKSQRFLKFLTEEAS